ncbi:metalloregulator ArsR/SmtB family transcription factor [Actinotalea sp. C106]|uniref:helix-turn-helix transcriptional regulator n=1 Tax=Actinotalea sp. C106 TaxID=2908644 RepID=UPI002028A9AC|nr:helix-turn-helix domain-containing protein [Actinotalea sp. C106]
MVDRAVSAHRALASESRMAILHVLQQHAEPLPLGEVATTVGLHPNTVREHLDRLAAAGFVASAPEVRHRRGRPRLLYRAVERPADATTDERARDELVRMLLSGYGRPMDSPRAEAEGVGCAWGSTMNGLAVTTDPEPGADAGPDVPAAAASRLRQLAALERHFEDLGFAPEAEPEQLLLHLRRCPVADLARERPEVVCSVHLGVARGVLGRQGGPLVADRLEPFVGPQHCVLHLAEV